MRGHLSSYHHTLTNVCIRATARRPGMTAMGAERPRPTLPELAETGTSAVKRVT